MLDVSNECLSLGSIQSYSDMADSLEFHHLQMLLITLRASHSLSLDSLIRCVGGCVTVSLHPSLHVDIALFTYQPCAEERHYRDKKLFRM